MKITTCTSRSWKRPLKSNDSVFCHFLQVTGSVMNQAICDRSVTAEAHDIFRESACGICSAQNGTGTGLFPNTYFFACKNLSTAVPYLYSISSIFDRVTFANFRDLSSHGISTGLESNLCNFPARQNFWCTNSYIWYMYRASSLDSIWKRHQKPDCLTKIILEIFSHCQ
jgi:hypothetical protein